jgi:hypothetical protein
MRRLLRAGRVESPGARRLQRMAAGLGFTPGVVSPRAGAAAKGSSIGLASVTAKKVGVLFLLAVVAGGGVVAVRGGARPVEAGALTTPASNTAVAVGTTSASASALERAVVLGAGGSVADPPAWSSPRGPASERPAAVARRAGPGVTSLPSAPSSSAAPSAASVEPPPPSPDTEASLVARAQQALRDDPARALDLTERTGDRFPSGALVQEREIVALEALLRLGRSDEARERGERFLRRFPGSVHQRQVERLLGADPGVTEP